MSETTYRIENAPSGRSKCKKCKEVIAKGELRLVTESVKEGQDFNFSSSTHVKCFVVPPRAMKGVSPEDFVDDHLEDHTDDDILDDPAKKAQVIADIAFKPPKVKKDAKATTPLGKRLEDIKKCMETLPESDSETEDEEERPAKKAKKSTGNDLEMYAKAMKIYGGMKVDDLKEVIRWNLGYGVTGTKDVLLMRVLDGHVNGRLARCSTCFQGKIQLNDADAGATAKCSGYYDEESAVRIPCSWRGPTSSAKRLQPWHSEEPTEEQMEEMKAITEKHEALASGGVGGGDGSDIPQDLLDAADELDWDIGDIKGCALSMYDICTSSSTKVDLPQDEKKAKVAIGKLLLNVRKENAEASAEEALKAVVKDFGITAVKAQAKAGVAVALKDSCANPANAGIAAVFQELGDLYFKEGNANAGGTYRKATGAIQGIDYAITEDNAKGLGKGKTKVANIGKGSADKIYEFVTTGTIQKLEEKRVAAA